MMESPSGGSLWSLGLQATPVALSLACGAPWFLLLYAPLVAVGREAEAEPAVTLLLATLLYVGCASLVDADLGPLLATTFGNVGIAAAMYAISLGKDEDDAGDVAAGPADEMSDFDRRLREASRLRDGSER